MLTDLFPWSLFVPAALWSAFRLRTPLVRLLLCWIAVIVLVFTFSSTKQDLYIFPITVAMAALIAGTFEHAASAIEPARRAVHWTWPVLGVTLLAFFYVMKTLFGDAGSLYFIRGAFAASLFLLAGAFAVLAFWWMRRTVDAVVSLAAVFVAVNTVLVIVSLPYFERFKPVAPLSAAAVARNPSARVIQFRVALPSMVWYLGKPVEEILDEPVLQARFDEAGETLVLLPAREYPAVQDMTPTCIVARQPLFDVKLSSVIAGTAMPEMLLVSNRCD
jgi:4-amino-4-deoxy-L-arabinose transferase-like glycosyltransferase